MVTLYVPNINDNNGGMTVIYNVRRGKVCAISPLNNNAPLCVQTIKQNRGHLEIMGLDYSM